MEGWNKGRNPVSDGCELQMSHTPFRTSFSIVVVGMELRVEREEGKEGDEQRVES